MKDRLRWRLNLRSNNERSKVSERAVPRIAPQSQVKRKARVKNMIWPSKTKMKLSVSWKMLTRTRTEHSRSKSKSLYVSSLFLRNVSTQLSFERFVTQQLWTQWHMLTKRRWSKAMAGAKLHWSWELQRQRRHRRWAFRSACRTPGRARPSAMRCSRQSASAQCTALRERPPQG